MRKLIVMIIIFALLGPDPLLADNTIFQEEILFQQLENLNLADLQREIQKINKEIEDYLRIKSTGLIKDLSVKVNLAGRTYSAILRYS